MKVLVKDLKRILADMDDDAVVLARDRNIANVEMVEVAGHPNPVDIEGVEYCEEMDDIPGVRDYFSYPGCSKHQRPTQVLVLCISD